MDLQQTIDRLFEVVVHGLKHANYPRTITLSKMYRQFVAGEDLDSLLKQFVRREDSTMFDQRKALTQHIVTAVCKNLTDVFYKVPRSNSSIRTLTYVKDKAQEDNIQKLNAILDKFWGVESFDNYMQTQYITLNMLDPNAFVVFEWKQFDNENESLQPYPFEVFSQDAIDYAYENRILEYLIVKGSTQMDSPGLGQGSKVRSKKALTKGDTYTLYMRNQTIKLTEVKNTPENMGGTSVEGEVTEVGKLKYVKLGQKYFLFTEYAPHNCDAVPAFRVGYNRDLVTNGAIMVSPIHAATPYLKKTIKVNSEFDLVISLLAFPQQIRYGAKCEDDKCLKGFYEDNKPCNTCGGTGIKKTAPSAQDAIIIQMPESKDEHIPLDELIKYISPPVDIIQFQDEYIDKLTRKCKEIVFNSEIFSKQEVAATATEKNISLQSVYDTLYPMAVAFGRNWQHGVVLVAKLTELNDGLVARYTFGKDFKLKTTADLMAELKEANESGADDSLINSINDDIAKVVFSEQPIEMQRHFVRKMFNPLTGKSEKDIALLLTLDYVPKRLKVLYSNLDYIFAELEFEFAERNEDFYAADKVTQRKAIEAQVDKIMEEIKNDMPEPILTLE